MASTRSLAPAGVEADTVVHYEVYTAGTGEDQLEHARRELLQTTLPHIHGYIWQHDRFDLRSSTQQRPPWHRQAASKGDQPACLWGSVNFGDNLEDEWFVTWLLQQLTRQHPGTIARVWDSDGDFLLIEAAYALPKWLKPETSTNRVWLYAGQLHVVPLQSATNPSLPPTPTVTQALQIVRSESVPTQASSGMQRAVASRLEGYPAMAMAEMHRARCMLPARLAHALLQDPQLVAPAVEAFYYRDVDDMKAAARLAHFPPQDLVTSLVKFNRCQYAQLAAQQFEAPPGFRLPLPSHPTFKAAELGMKLTCGFEMMYCNRARFGGGDAAAAEGAGTQAQHAERGAGQAAADLDSGLARDTDETTTTSDLEQNGRQLQDMATSHSWARDAAPSGSGTNQQQQQQEQQQQQAAAESYRVPAPLAANREWQAYRASLERHGYFQGNIPGSGQHSRLLRTAAEQYQQTEAYRRSAATLAAPAVRLDELLGEPVDIGAIKQAAAGPEDHDAWMRSGAAELEAELAQRQRELEGDVKRQSGRSCQQPEAEAGFDPDNLADQLKGFVAAMSSYEGAEVPDSGGEVSLDDRAFLTELSRALGVTLEAPSPGHSESEEEGSSFFSEEGEGSEASSSGDEADEAERDVGTAQQAQHVQPAATAVHTSARQQPSPGFASGGMAPTEAKLTSSQPTQQVPASASEPDLPSASHHGDDEEAWEVATATDSDDVGYDRFVEEYDRMLSSELAASRMVESFERASLQEASTTAADARTKPAAAAGAATGRSNPSQPAEPSARQQSQQEERAQHAEGHEPEEQLQPVDVDLNLVQSLLASYASQQGLPGPASNLAGLLGLRLPDDADAR